MALLKFRVTPCSRGKWSASLAVELNSARHRLVRVPQFLPRFPPGAAPWRGCVLPRDGCDWQDTWFTRTRPNEPTHWHGPRAKKMPVAVLELGPNIKQRHTGVRHKSLQLI